MNGVPVQPAPHGSGVLLLVLNKMPHLPDLLFLIMGQLVRKRLVTHTKKNISCCTVCSQIQQILCRWTQSLRCKAFDKYTCRHAYVQGWPDWAVVYFRQFCESYRRNAKFWLTFLHARSYVPTYVLALVWAVFWPIFHKFFWGGDFFSHIHLFTLIGTHVHRTSQNDIIVHE
jgi:hypothetical protein